MVAEDEELKYQIGHRKESVSNYGNVLKWVIQILLFPSLCILVEEDCKKTVDWNDYLLDSAIIFYAAKHTVLLLGILESLLLDFPYHSRL
jgi:hypothetical protein